MAAMIRLIAVAIAASIAQTWPAGSPPELKSRQAAVAEREAGATQRLRRDMRTGTLIVVGSVAGVAVVVFVAVRAARSARRNYRPAAIAAIRGGMKVGQAARGHVAGLVSEARSSTESGASSSASSSTSGPSAS